MEKQNNIKSMKKDRKTTCQSQIMALTVADKCEIENICVIGKRTASYYWAYITSYSSGLTLPYYERCILNI